MFGIKLINLLNIVCKSTCICVSMSRVKVRLFLFFDIVEVLICQSFVLIISRCDWLGYFGLWNIILRKL